MNTVPDMLKSTGLALRAVSQGYEVDAEPQNLPEACLALTQIGARLADMIATDERGDGGGFGQYYLFSLPPYWITVRSTAKPEHPVYASVTPSIPAANWYEREARDMFGLIPQGHPNAHRLVLHRDWPSGVYPLRKDFSADEQPERLPEPHSYQEVEGEGVFVVPVGPIHAGIIEPGHFRFSTVGEFIINLEARLFYTHRGVEKNSEGRSAQDALLIAERTCGVCALSHGFSFSQAVEAVAGATLPERANYLRVIFMELERLYNHIGDVGNICAGVGAALGNMRGAVIKEELLRLNERLFGHRYLRGLCVPGGVTRDLDREAADELLAKLDGTEKEFAFLCENLLKDKSFLDRVKTTGCLEKSVAKDLGVVGVAARASGIDLDGRRDHPHAAYGRLRFQVPTYAEGDVWARIMVRIDEVRQSIGIIRQCLRDMPTGAVLTDLGPLPSGATGFGWSESARGENIHWIRTDGEGRIDRLRIRSASYCNWPAVPYAVPGNIVPDFPLINKSFELCYSCTDR